MIRIAAVGDVHYDQTSGGRLARHWQDLRGKADCLLIAGDLTQLGTEEEIAPLAEDLAECPVPVVTIFGNHDYHANQQDRLRARLEDAGVTVLERSSTVLKVHQLTLGVYGLKGFGGGFLGACCSDFGEPEMKSFVHHTKVLAEGLHSGLQALKTDYKVVLMHYSPTPETLLGEKKEIYPFLGSYLLGQAIDNVGANVVFHGHAHKGTEKGATPGGIPVRNVAQPVIRQAFSIYCLHELGESLSCQATTGTTGSAAFP